MTQAAPATYGSDREYETIYVLRPDVDRENTERVATRVADVIGKSGGKLTRVENWGRRRLAYDVNKYKRGVYVYLKYVGRGNLVSELERNLRMLDSVLKFQSVKLRDGLRLESVSVSEDEVKFEHVEAAPEEELEESLAQTLGLEERREESSAEQGEEGASAGADAKPAAGAEAKPAAGAEQEGKASSGGEEPGGDKSESPRASKGDGTEEEE